MSMDHVTKNDIYAELIQTGVGKGYCVIPEFRVGLEGGKRNKNIDLVWATRKSSTDMRQNCESLKYWTLHATFEIDACDVRNIPGKEFNRHVCDLPNIKNIDPGQSICHFIVLYTSAHDRNWNHRRNVEVDVALRKKWANGTVINVLDGRDLFVVHGLPTICRDDTAL